jgi:DNA-3-methyladenine glycosylase II
VRLDAEVATCDALAQAALARLEVDLHLDAAQNIEAGGMEERDRIGVARRRPREQAHRAGVTRFLHDTCGECAAHVQVMRLVLANDHTPILLLQLPDPYDFELSTGRFRAFGTDLANRLVDGTLHRAVGTREVRIVARPGGVDVEPLDEETRPVVERLLGAPFDLVAFYEWAARDRVLGPITRRLCGFRPPLQPDPFEALVTSITAQQVSLFAAVAIRNRMIERLGVRVGEAWTFPTRERIAASSEEELYALGFSRRKAEYTITLARGDLDVHGLAALNDDEVRARITSQRGLGPWTAEWFLARHLARPHAWPAGDLALRKAAESLYGVGVTELGPRLHPFQNLSAHYLLTGWLTLP